MRTTVCLAGLLLCGSAAAAPRLAVVPLHAPAELTFTGRSLSEAIAGEARRAGGGEVLGAAEVEARLGRAASGELVRCADDARCLAERARKLSVDRLVGGWLEQRDGRYVVVVVHVDARSGATVASFRREIPVASRRLRDDVVAASAGLLRGDADAAGWLAIDATVQGASVTIDGRPAGTTPLRRRIEAGRHRVEVSKIGHAAADPVWLEVPAGQTVEHHQRLYSIPARDRRPDEAAAETQVQLVR